MTVPAQAARLDLRALLDPSSCAVYGLSERTSRRLARNLSGFGAAVHGINPTTREACGIPCCPSMADLPHPAELAVLQVGTARVDAAVEDALAAGGLRAVVAPGLGAEAGREGREVAARVARRLREAGVALVGPNCMGVATPGRPSPYVGTLTDDFVGGRAAVIAQSGSIAEAMTALGPRVGFRTVISSGAEALTDAADYLRELAADEETRVVGLFLEAVRRPAAFEEALEAIAEAGKTAVVLKVGRSRLAAAAALAHTGAIAGSDLAVAALLRRYGAIRVDDFADWVEHLEAFARGRRPRGPRIGAVTASGGEAGLFADVAEREGALLELPSPALAARIRSEFPGFEHVGNPVDCWAVAEEREIFPRVFELMADSGEFDVLVSLTDHSQWLVDGERRLARAIAEDLVEACRGRTVEPCIVTVTTADAWISDLHWARERDLPLLKGTVAGLRALSARTRARPPVAPRRLPAPAERVEGDGALAELESAALLERYGVPYVGAERCTSPAQAVEAARRLGYPVAVKLDGVAHKSRAGGVALRLADDGAVRAAAERLGGRVVVAREAPPGVEILVGAVRDPQVGPVVVAGIGGALAEPLATVAADLAPLDEAAAARLVEAVPPLVGVLGGRVPAAVASAVAAVSRLAAEHPEVVEVDVNPLLVHGERAVALDALVVLAPAARRAHGGEAS